MIAAEYAMTKQHRRFWTAVWTVWVLNLLAISIVVAYRVVVGSTWFL